MTIIYFCFHSNHLCISNAGLHYLFVLYKGFTVTIQHANTKYISIYHYFLASKSWQMIHFFSIDFILLLPRKQNLPINNFILSKMYCFVIKISFQHQRNTDFLLFYFFSFSILSPLLIPQPQKHYSIHNILIMIE